VNIENPIPKPNYNNLLASGMKFQIFGNAKLLALENYIPNHPGA